MAIKRGDLVAVSVAGDYGKPRLAVVIQSDWLSETGSVLVCLMTTALQDTPIYRLTIEPTPENGLKATSQIMVDKIFAVRRDKLGAVFGRLEDAKLFALNRMLTVVTGIAD